MPAQTSPKPILPLSRRHIFINHHHLLHHIRLRLLRRHIHLPLLHRIHRLHHHRHHHQRLLHRQLRLHHKPLPHHHRFPNSSCQLGLLQVPYSLAW